MLDYRVVLHSLSDVTIFIFSIVLAHFVRPKDTMLASTGQGTAADISGFFTAILWCRCGECRLDEWLCVTIGCAAQSYAMSMLRHCPESASLAGHVSIHLCESELRQILRSCCEAGLLRLLQLLGSAAERLLSDIWLCDLRTPACHSSPTGS